MNWYLWAKKKTINFHVYRFWLKSKCKFFFDITESKESHTAPSVWAAIPLPRTPRPRWKPAPRPPPPRPAPAPGDPNPPAAPRPPRDPRMAPRMAPRPRPRTSVMGPPPRLLHGRRPWPLPMTPGGAICGRFSLAFTLPFPSLCWSDFYE